MDKEKLNDEEINNEKINNEEISNDKINDDKINDDKLNVEKLSKKAYKAGIITGIIWGIAIIFAFILGANIVAAKKNSGSQASALNSSALTGSSKSSVIKQYIDKYFYEKVDSDELVEGMYAGMLASLGDKYSAYFDKETYEAMTDKSAGEYTGIGVVVSYNADTNTSTVAKVYENSPAHEAGIEAGDIIYSVDGTLSSSITYEELVSKVRGEEGSEIKVEVKRNDEIIEYTMERREVEVDVVYYEMLENNIGYIVLDQFTDSASNQFKDAIVDLQSQGMEKVIVDVRDNPGGSLTTLEDVLNCFLPKNKLLLYSMTKEGEKTEDYSKNEPIIPDMPMCVLVNGNSASASEAFTGAIKSYDRGTVIGTQTYGKGIMQSTFDLGDGTAIKLTVGKYYLPDGSNIHEVGIEPDYVVEVPDTISNIWEVEHKDDPQLMKAIEVLEEK